MNLQALSGPQLPLYRCLVRPFLSAEARDFFEGIPGIPGQMYLAERRALHDALLHRAPRYAFEIGTYNGAGSTYFSAQALARLGRGRLITLEIEPTLHSAALDLYTRRLPHLRAHVEFLLGDSATRFEPFLREAGSAEFVFLDGAENAAESLAQFRFFSPWFRPGSVLALHDWNTEKMRLVRQAITSAGDWRERLALGEPDSVGFAVYERT